MSANVLIVEDKFVEADYLRMILTKAGYHVLGIAHSVAQAREMIKVNRPYFVLLDIFLKGKETGIDLARELEKDNIAFVYLSANSNEEVLNAAKATQPYGFLVKPFREKDLLVTMEIARYRHEHSLETKIQRESVLTDKIQSIVLTSIVREEKLLQIAATLQTYVSFDYITYGFQKEEESLQPGISFLRIGFEEYQLIGVPELMTITGLKLKDLQTRMQATQQESSTTICNEHEFEEISRRTNLHQLFSNQFQVKSFITLPLHLSNGIRINIYFYSRKAGLYHRDHINALNRLQPTLLKGFESMMSNEKTNIAQVHNKTNESSSGLPDTSPVHFEGIIGNSHLLLNVFDLVTQVAPTDTSVLILGESGTGKERIADYIHQLSPRKNKPFVKVNCATLPSTLIESELFGHEKGAFTGAIEKRIGKFEKADHGTIFLDEIGEMPLDLQVKMLRVLQEKYIERIGSTSITKVDVRIIAATNRNLEKEVAEGRFRLDLYYRLNVFPISLPSLRERTEDIPSLAQHFIHVYNRKAGKKITDLSDKVLKNMMAYHWPGNIRELENAIERGILLAKGNIIEDMLIPSAQVADTSSDNRMKTIYENERDHIMTVLKKCNGRIWGAGGAAEVLNVPPTTLKSKMKKLGIQKNDFE